MPAFGRNLGHADRFWFRFLPCQDPDVHHAFPSVKPLTTDPVISDTHVRCGAPLSSPATPPGGPLAVRVLMMRNSTGPVSGEHRLEVTLEESASRWGNPGFEVLSTPAILGHTERLCADLLEPFLDEGEMSLGVSVEMRHQAPAQVGEVVVIEADLQEATRKPSFSFVVKAVDGAVLCEGSHQRAVVDAAWFRGRLTQ
jgi:predicted thioesterase